MGNGPSGRCPNERAQRPTPCPRRKEVRIEAALDVDTAEAIGADVGREGSGELRCDPTVAEAGGLADHEYAAHELGVLVGNVQQFIRGHDGGRGRRHAENVGGWCESINGRSIARRE